MVLGRAGVLRALSVDDDLATQAELNVAGLPSLLAVTAAGSGVALRDDIGPLQVIAFERETPGNGEGRSVFL